MSGLRKLQDFCTKDGRDYPSRLEIKNELERLVKEEGDPKEFILFPFAFKTQEDFRLSVQHLWDAGYRAVVTVSKGEKHNG